MERLLGVADEFSPVVLEACLIKALPSQGGKMAIKIRFSSHGLDLQGDETTPESISDANRQYLQGRVAINWNHESDPSSQIGIIRDIWTEYKGNGPTGEPQWEGWCIADLLPNSRKAREVWALLQSDADLGASYEGIAVQVQPDGLGGRILQKIWIRAIAITPTPVHPDTAVRMASANEARELNALVKSLSVGAGVVGADATGGQALRPQSLGGKVANTTVGTPKAAAPQGRYTAEDIGRALVYWKSPSLTREQAKALVAALLDENPNPKELNRFVGLWLKRQGFIDAPIYKALAIKRLDAAIAHTKAGGNSMPIDESTEQEGLEAGQPDESETSEAPNADAALSELAKALEDNGRASSEEEDEEDDSDKAEGEAAGSEYDDTEEDEDEDEDEKEPSNLKKALDNPDVSEILDAAPAFEVILKSLAADAAASHQLLTELQEQVDSLHTRLDEISERSEESTTIIAKALLAQGAKPRPLKGVPSGPGEGQGILEKSLTPGAIPTTIEDASAFMVAAGNEGVATPHELSIFNVDGQVPQGLSKSFQTWKQTGRVAKDE